MSRHATQITIAAHPDQVWPVLAAVVDWPAWTPTITAVEPLGDPTLVVGARYRIRQPKLAAATWTVINLDPGRCFTWENSTLGVKALAAHVLVPLAGGHTRVELTVDLRGPLSSLIEALAGGLTQSYIEQEAAALKAHVEGQPTSTTTGPSR